MIPAESETVRALKAELEISRASRRRAWEVLQELRKILTDLGNREVPAPKEKSFQAEGVLLKRRLRVCLEERNEAIAGLAAAARRIDKAAFGSEADFPQAHQALLTILDKAEPLVRRLPAATTTQAQQTRQCSYRQRV